jgi:hypothetical protein
VSFTKTLTLYPFFLPPPKLLLRYFITAFGLSPDSKHKSLAAASMLVKEIKLQPFCSWHENKEEGKTPSYLF